MIDVREGDAYKPADKAAGYKMLDRIVLFFRTYVKPFQVPSLTPQTLHRIRQHRLHTLHPNRHYTSSFLKPSKHLL